MNDIWEKYENIEEINSGMYKKVIKGKNKTTGEYVAIKQINKLNLKDSNKYLSLINKIKLLSLENYIDIIETYNSKDYIYIIMELCLFNLNEYMKIRNERLSIEELKYLLIEINKILKKMNELNIIHIDLKLSNILMNFNKINKISSKLCNFGISKNHEK